MKYDAIVIGGGPAGSSVSYHLSKGGLKVLLLEKDTLPRFKLCAGCLSARTLKLLPEGYEALILNRIKAGRLGFGGKKEYRVEAHEEIAYIVDRKDFDYFLVREALKAGAELLQEEFIGFERDGEGYRVYTSKGTYRTDFLIGADGAHSKLAKLLGYKKKSYKSLEFFTEGNLRDEVLIEIGLVSRGYLWVFPHGDGISVGIATRGKEDLLKILKDYSKLKGIKYVHPKGWHIPFPEKELQLGKGRIMLVGDAASMADPLLGEGIFYALWAGKLLSQSIMEDPANPIRAYKKYLKPLERELSAANKIARLAYSFQHVAYKMGKDFALKSFYKVLLGQKGYRDLYYRGWLRFLKDLILWKFMGIMGRHEGGNTWATFDGERRFIK